MSNEVKENVSNVKFVCVYGSSKKICRRFVEILFPEPWRYASKQVVYCPEASTKTQYVFTVYSSSRRLIELNLEIPFQKRIVGLSW